MRGWVIAAATLALLATLPLPVALMLAPAVLIVALIAYADPGRSGRVSRRLGDSRDWPL